MDNGTNGLGDFPEELVPMASVFHSLSGMYTCLRKIKEYFDGIS